MKLKSLIIPEQQEKRRVWKSGEYESVASAIEDIYENIGHYPSEVHSELKRMCHRLRQLNQKHGTMEI